jgi:alkanesulfonate monooxygenase SsuD/methylene tetrahydromethanopterin reductase-like flavin-dependent oxidoreductase (luciferase family)
VSRPFRFGVVTPVSTDLPAWRDDVRRVADAGFDTVLVPDVPQWQPAPAALLATAAALADVRVGSWVHATPFRPAWELAWEAHSLTVVTEGRFELGLGTGRPGLEDELASYGLPDVPAAERLDRAREAVERLRELDGPSVHTPVVMAVRGPRARALAAEVADTVTIASFATDSRAEVVALARSVLAVRDVEIALHVPVVGDAVAPFMASARETDPVALREADSLAVLPADPGSAVEELLRRREELGASYVVVGVHAVDLLAPVVAELAGR